MSDSAFGIGEKKFFCSDFGVEIEVSQRVFWLKSSFVAGFLIKWQTLISSARREDWLFRKEPSRKGACKGSPLTNTP